MAAKTRAREVDAYTVVCMRACNEWPYMSKSLLGLTPVIVEAEPHVTMAVDKYARVYICPDRIDLSGKKSQSPNGYVRWDVIEGATVFRHENDHFLFRHFERAEPFVLRDGDGPEVQALLGLCMDAEINDYIGQDRNARLPGGVRSARYGWPLNQLFEVYYELARNQIKQTGAYAEALRHDLDQQENHGSGSHGVEMPWEKGAPGGVDEKGKRTPAGMGSAEAEALRKEVAKDIQEAAARNPGSVPGYLQRWAKRELRPPTVPWEKELSALIHSAMSLARGCVDYSYALPNRRGNFCGVIMPALVRPLPQAAVVIDTSGSMSESDLVDALSETRGVIRACGQHQVPVYCCDAAVSEVQKVRDVKNIQLNGGSGTDMGVGIEQAAGDGHRVVICLTDGCTPWPSEAPRGVQLVVALIGSRVSRQQVRAGVPKWAKAVVEVTREDDEERAA